jgi:hypothetical protein
MIPPFRPRAPEEVERRVIRNPHVRPAAIDTEDEAAVLEYAECYDVSFEGLLRWWWAEPPKIPRIKEVLQWARPADGAP